MTLSIGDLETHEIEPAVTLWRQVGLTRPWNDPHADIRLALASPAATVLAGRLEGRLAATAMVGADGHRGWVYYLAVSPEARGRGYGEAMMRAAERWAAARGVPKIQLMVRAGNTAVLGFYEAIGYERSDVVVMARWLRGEPVPRGSPAETEEDA